MIMKRLTAILIAATLLLVPQTGSLAQTARSKKQLIKENAQLRSLVDSLRLELELWEQEDAALLDSIVQESEISEAAFPEIYSTEVTDSLLSLWYLQRQQSPKEEDAASYDMDSVRFTSNVPDSVLIQRLEKMNSFITLPFNETVKNYMILYTEKSRTKMQRILGLSPYYMPIFEEAFSKYSLPEELKVMSIIESALNPTATSRAGAKGIWQFMHNTGKNYGLNINSFVDERMDVVKAADAAARYLKDTYRIFGDWCLAISAYNCGVGNVNKAIKRAGGKRDFWSIYPYLPKETRGYMPAFVGALYAMNYYREYGLVPDPCAMPAATDTFEIHRNLHFQQISEVIGVPMETVRDLNPQYINDIIPGNEASYTLILPYTYTNAFIELQDSLYAHKSSELFSEKVVKNISSGAPSGSVVYKVKSGDYLGKIASRYHVTVKQLKSWNNLRSDNLSIGQTLYIYGGSASSSSSSASKASSTKASTSKPASTTFSGEYTLYTVKAGDSLYSIARNYHGVSAQNIMDFNGISSSLSIGQVIKIPKM